jgi:hypothetical protein
MCNQAAKKLCLNYRPVIGDSHLTRFDNRAPQFRIRLERGRRHARVVIVKRQRRARDGLCAWRWAKIKGSQEDRRAGEWKNQQAVHKAKEQTFS